jgi:hypothetical protein
LAAYITHKLRYLKPLNLHPANNHNHILNQPLQRLRLIILKLDPLLQIPNLLLLRTKIKHRLQRGLSRHQLRQLLFPRLTTRSELLALLAFEAEAVDETGHDLELAEFEFEHVGEEVEAVLGVEDLEAADGFADVGVVGDGVQVGLGGLEVVAQELGLVAGQKDYVGVVCVMVMGWYSGIIRTGVWLQPGQMLLAP